MVLEFVSSPKKTIRLLRNKKSPRCDRSISHDCSLCHVGSRVRKLQARAVNECLICYGPCRSLVAGLSASHKRTARPVSLCGKVPCPIRTHRLAVRPSLNSGPKMTNFYVDIAIDSVCLYQEIKDGASNRRLQFRSVVSADLLAPTGGITARNGYIAFPKERSRPIDSGF